MIPPNNEFQTERRHGVAGFTLTEVLVTVGITALLAGLLLPSISGAAYNGKKAQSVARLRNIGVAVQQYVGENAGHLPGGGVDYASRWFHQLSPYMGLPATREREGVPHYWEAYQNGKTEHLFTCPVLHGKPAPGGGTYDARYGYNNELTGAGGTMRGVRLVAIPRPASTVMVATKAGSDPGLRAVPYPQHPFGVAATLRKDHNPEGGANPETGEMGETGYLFCDGHVEVRTKFIGREAFLITN